MAEQVNENPATTTKKDVKGKSDSKKLPAKGTGQKQIPTADEKLEKIFSSVSSLKTSISQQAKSLARLSKDFYGSEDDTEDYDGINAQLPTYSDRYYKPTQMYDKDYDDDYDDDTYDDQYGYDGRAGDWSSRYYDGYDNDYDDQYEEAPDEPTQPTVTTSTPAKRP